MDLYIEKTLAILDETDDTEERRAALLRLINLSKAHVILRDCHEFQADRGLVRVVGFDTEGKSIMIPGRLPEAGENIEHGGTVYHIESLKSVDGHANPKPANAGSQAARKG